MCGGLGFLTCPGIEKLLLVGVALSSSEEPICWMMPASSEAGSAPRTYTCGRRGRGGRKEGCEAKMAIINSATTLQRKLMIQISSLLTVSFPVRSRSLNPGLGLRLTPHTKTQTNTIYVVHTWCNLSLFLKNTNVGIAVTSYLLAVF